MPERALAVADESRRAFRQELISCPRSGCGSFDLGDLEPHHGPTESNGEDYAQDPQRPARHSHDDVWSNSGRADCGGRTIHSWRPPLQSRARAILQLSLWGFLFKRAKGAFGNPYFNPYYGSYYAPQYYYGNYRSPYYW